MIRDHSALTLGVLFLGMHRGSFYSALRELEYQLDKLENQTSVENLYRTSYWSLKCLAAGCRDLMRFLLKGNDSNLDKADFEFEQAVHALGCEQYLDVRWVAAQLRWIKGELKSSSVWTVLPPDTPDAVKKAFTYGSPSILSLWPPQINLVQNESGTSALDPTTRRIVLSVPTSGGKTMISQMVALCHLASSPNRGVCFIVPTRSLAREVRDSLFNRLRSYRRTISYETTDWADLDESGDVMVVTPERLAFLIRNDVSELLKRFSLFIFDEVHTISDKSRGFVSESCISILHWLTQESDHRIMVMSAALGNRGHISQWIDPGSEGVSKHSDWRGPRRLHAIYTTDIDWEKRELHSYNSRDWPKRASFPMYGQIRLRLSSTGDIRTLKTNEPVGEYSVRVDNKGNLDRNENNRLKKIPTAKYTTPFYKTFPIFLKLLGESGPVLVV